MERPDSIHGELHKAIGRLVWNWARLESLLDNISDELFANWGGNVVEAEAPRQFSRKVRFIRKCVNAHPVLVKFAPLLARLFDQMSDVAKCRNEIIHSSIGVIDDDNYHFHG